MMVEAQKIAHSFQYLVMTLKFPLLQGESGHV